MTRRMYHYDASTGFQPYLIVAAIGAGIIALGVVFQVLQIIVSLKNKNKDGYRDVTGDPWDGRTLEWATASPPAFYNFAHTPVVSDIDAFWEQKTKGLDIENKPKTEKKVSYQDIHMPKNTAVGFVMGIFAFMFSFAMVWHIWWLAIVGLTGAIFSLILRSLDYDTDYYVKASEVEATEMKYQQGLLEVKI